MGPGEPVSGGSGWGCAWLEVEKVEWEGRVPHLVCILGERDCVWVWAYTCTRQRCGTLQRKLCGFKVLWVTAVLPLSSFSPSPEAPMGRAFQSTVSAPRCHAQTCPLQLPILSNFTPALEDPTSPPQFAVLSVPTGRVPLLSPRTLLQLSPLHTNKFHSKSTFVNLICSRPTKLA